MGVFNRVTPDIRKLRNLLYCGEWIESHVLHMFMLHLPDFLGYESVITMAADHAPAVKAALRMKKLGNALVALLAGRAVHPVGVCVGGFYHAPDKTRAAELVAETRACVDLMSELTLFLSEKLEYPTLERDYEFVSLCPDDEYPMNLGRIKSNKGLNVDQESYGDAIEEKHAQHTTALQSVIRGRGAYMVGPLARLNLNSHHLHPRAAELLPKVCDAVKKKLPWRNNFLSLPARALETVHALALSADILQWIVDSPTIDPCRIPVPRRSGVGGHGTEAPRGVCWHHYRTQEDGAIASARIIPPTSQNQLSIEEDLRDYAASLAELDDEKATLRCEHLIRNYDPCISCSVHFLKLKRNWLDKPLQPR